MCKRLRVCRYLVLSTTLAVVCDAQGAPLSDSYAYQECMDRKTKAACDTSQAACMLFLSDVGQQQAKKSCLETLRAATQGEQIAPEDAPPLAKKKPRRQRRKKLKPPERGVFHFERQTGHPPNPTEPRSRRLALLWPHRPLQCSHGITLRPIRKSKSEIASFFAV